jgi:hypothetical protein
MLDVNCSGISLNLYKANICTTKVTSYVAESDK